MFLRDFLHSDKFKIFNIFRPRFNPVLQVYVFPSLICFYRLFKSQPLDSQKVRSSLSGILYAFEIPLPPAVENTISSTSAVATDNETTGAEQPRGDTSAETRVEVEVETSAADRPPIVTEHRGVVPTIRAELTRSPSRSSSERSLGGTLKLPCLSRQTSDDEDDDENIEVASDMSGKSNMGLLRQLSPRFIRKLTNRKQGWNVSQAPGASSEQNDQSAASSTKTTPGHSRNTSISSTSGTPVHAGAVQLSQKPLGYVVGMHRKLVTY